MNVVEVINTIKRLDQPINLPNRSSVEREEEHDPYLDLFVLG